MMVECPTHSASLSPIRACGLPAPVIDPTRLGPRGAGQCYGYPHESLDTVAMINPAPASPGEKVMPAPRERGRRLLDPIDRSSEILFALIMVLAITCSL